MGKIIGGRKMKKWFLGIVASALLFVGCASGDVDDSDMEKVVVGVVGEFNIQWDTVNEILAKDNIKVELMKFSDYATPNIALNDGEIDMNAFQNMQFLDNEIEIKGYDLVPIGDMHIPLMGMFHNKDKVSSLEDLKDGDTIAIPSDLVNGGRALKVMETAGLIEVDPSKGYTPTLADITKYHIELNILEAESATLANLLPDCAAALINGNNAFTAGLNPLTDAIYVESTDPSINQNLKNVVNVMVVQAGEEENELYQKVVEAYQSEEVRYTLQSEYQGAYIPAWDLFGQ